MVSGDYYDYQLVDGKLAIAIGDVAGKGISAALLMATIQAALRMELRALGTGGELAASLNGTRFSTARMVSELNQQLYATTSPEKYATFFFAIYDPATGLITYTNAGHLQPVLFRNGGQRRLRSQRARWWARFRSRNTRKASWNCAAAICWCATPTASPSPKTNTARCSAKQRLIELVAKNADRDEAQIIASVMESVTAMDRNARAVRRHDACCWRASDGEPLPLE